MSDQPKPVVIFRGNCQAHHTAAIFDGAGLSTTYVEGADYGFLPAFRGALTRYVGLPQALDIIQDAKDQGCRVVVAQQVTPLVDADLSPYLPLVDEIVRFPFLQFNAGARKHYADAAFAANRLRRLYRTDFDMMRLSQEKAGTAFDFAGYIETEHPAGPLFHATTHPGPVLTSLLFRVVADQILPDHPALAGIEEVLSSREGLNFMSDLYVSPEGRELLGFEWPNTYDLYSGMLEAADRGDWHWMDRRIDELTQHFSDDTLFIYHHVRYLLAHLRAAEARPLVEQLLQREPGCSWFWHLGLEVELFGGPDGTRAMIGRAADVLQSSTIGPGILAGMRARANELGIEV